MTEKDYTLYGTKIFNSVTQEIGLLICIWKNKFADAEIDYATCVDKVGKRYNVEFDNIEVLDDLVEQIVELLQNNPDRMKDFYKIARALVK
jgi:hypothetical protein